MKEGSGNNPKISAEAVKQVLLLYDHEKSFYYLSPDVLRQLETLMGYEAMDWPSDEDRAMMISHKVDQLEFPGRSPARSISLMQYNLPSGLTPFAWLCRC